MYCYRLPTPSATSILLILQQQQQRSQGAATEANKALTLAYLEIIWIAFKPVTRYESNIYMKTGVAVSCRVVLLAITLLNMFC